MIETATASFTTLRDVLERAEQLDWDWVLFLPGDPASWSCETAALVVPEDEVDDDDRHPDADKRALKYALNISAVQDVTANALTQRSDADVNLLVDALRYYFTRDAFIVLPGGSSKTQGS